MRVCLRTATDHLAIENALPFATVDRFVRLCTANLRRETSLLLSQGLNAAAVPCSLWLFAQVFDGGLPPNLPLVWNPRLTSTAGQVVDDGSQNRLKASLEERVPVRLELSTKVRSARMEVPRHWLKLVCSTNPSTACCCGLYC